MYSKIIGTGSYFPEQRRTNADLEKVMETSDEWITTRTGIKERRIASPEETVAYMGAEAAKKAIEMAGINAADIDLQQVIMYLYLLPHVKYTSCLICRQCQHLMLLPHVLGLSTV